MVRFRSVQASRKGTTQSLPSARTSQAPHYPDRGMALLWRRLGFEQKVAAVAAVLLIVSTFGQFSFVEAATVVSAGAVLALLRLRALGRHFHLPGGDGLVIMVAAGWCAVLIAARVLDRPLGQTVLALACTAVLAGAGLRERVRRPPDDISVPPPYEDVTAPVARDEDLTEPLARDDDSTLALPGERVRPVRNRPPRPEGPPRPR